MAEMTNRSRGGRPAGGGDRVDELKVRLKAGEKEAIREKARQRGFSSMTDFVRHELLTRRFAGEQGGLTLTQFTQVVQLIREYKAIGNNINQIARKANETHSIYAEDIEILKGGLSEICRMLNQFLSELPSTKR